MGIEFGIRISNFPGQVALSLYKSGGHLMIRILCVCIEIRRIYDNQTL